MYSITMSWLIQDYHSSILEWNYTRMSNRYPIVTRVPTTKSSCFLTLFCNSVKLEDWPYNPFDFCQRSGKWTSKESLVLSFHDLFNSQIHCLSLLSNNCTMSVYEGCLIHDLQNNDFIWDSRPLLRLFNHYVGRNFSIITTTMASTAKQLVQFNQ